MAPEVMVEVGDVEVKLKGTGKAVEATKKGNGIGAPGDSNQQSVADDGIPNAPKRSRDAPVHV
jgi:hypothetical protein